MPTGVTITSHGGAQNSYMANHEMMYDEMAYSSLSVGLRTIECEKRSFAMSWRWRSAAREPGKSGASGSRGLAIPLLVAPSPKLLAPGEGRWAKLAG